MWLILKTCILLHPMSLETFVELWLSWARKSVYCSRSAHLATRAWMPCYLANLSRRFQSETCHLRAPLGYRFSWLLSTLRGNLALEEKFLVPVSRAKGIGKVAARIDLPVADLPWIILSPRITRSKAKRQISQDYHPVSEHRERGDEPSDPPAIGSKCHMPTTMPSSQGTASRSARERGRSGRLNYCGHTRFYCTQTSLLELMNRGVLD